MTPLIFRPVRLAEAPYAILEHAHWVPSAARLSERYPFAQAKDGRQEKRFLQLRRHWRTQEIWLTHALECVILGFGALLLRDVFVDERAGSEPCDLYSADLPGINRDIGVPDLIVVRGETLFLVEVKSGSTRANHRYSLGQHRKYMKCAALALCSGAMVEDAGAPFQFTRVVHWLLAPSARIGDVVNDFSDWRPAIDGAGELTIGDEVARRTLEEDVAAFLRTRAAKYGLDPERYGGLAQVPTKLICWSDFAGTLRRVALDAGRSDLDREAERVEQLSRGSAPLRLMA